MVGAIFGSLEVLADRSVLKEQYVQDKKIPDWMQYDITTETQPVVEELQRSRLERCYKAVDGRRVTKQ